MFRKILTLILIAWTLPGKAQINNQVIPEIYITPAITIGYTFRCGWNYGIDLTMSFIRVENTLPHTNIGINTQFYIINYQNERHKITNFNIVVDNAVTQFGIGLGTVSKSWGYKRINREIAPGANITINFGTGFYQLPWLGINAFIPSESWAWSSLPYYISYKFYWRQEPYYIRK